MEVFSMAFRPWVPGKSVRSLWTGQEAWLIRAADFDRPSGSRLGFFTAIQNIGGFCALFFASYAADLLGRRKGVALGLIAVFIGTILQGSLLVDQG